MLSAIEPAEPPEGTVLLGTTDTADVIVADLSYLLLAMRGQVEVRTSTSHSDNLVHNRVSLLAEVPAEALLVTTGFARRTGGK